MNAYVVYSTKCIQGLRNDISKCGETVDISIMLGWDRYKKRHVPSNDKNIVICNQQVMECFISSHPDIKVEPYDWSSFPMYSVGESLDLHISGIPNDYTQTDAEEYIRDRVSKLVDVSKFTVYFPYSNRETGSIHGYGTVAFDESVDEYTIKLCKVLLHNKYIEYKESKVKSIVSARWSRNESSRESSRDTDRDKGISGKRKIYSWSI